MYKKLIKNRESITEDKVTLFCLPFAGGGASAYNQWVKKAQDMFNVCPIQLPGREDRIMEKPYETMNVMLDDLEQAIINVLKGPYALWGHSMGGKIGYELEKRMEKRGYTAKCFLVSGSRVPYIQETNPISHLSNSDFKEKLARFEGTPKEILDNQELLDFFLPMLRADFSIDETYYSSLVIQLQCPIIAFCGEDDREVSVEEMKAWEEYTENSFDYCVFPGGHFFIREREEDVIQTIAERLWRNWDEN